MFTFSTEESHHHLGFLHHRLHWLQISICIRASSNGAKYAPSLSYVLWMLYQTSSRHNHLQGLSCAKVAFIILLHLFDYVNVKVYFDIEPSLFSALYYELKVFNLFCRSEVKELFNNFDFNFNILNNKKNLMWTSFWFIRKMRRFSYSSKERGTFAFSLILPSKLNLFLSQNHRERLRRKMHSEVNFLFLLDSVYYL